MYILLLIIIINQQEYNSICELIKKDQELSHLLKITEFDSQEGLDSFILENMGKEYTTNLLRIRDQMEGNVSGKGGFYIPTNMIQVLIIIIIQALILTSMSNKIFKKMKDVSRRLQYKYIIYIIL